MNIPNSIKLTKTPGFRPFATPIRNILKEIYILSLHSITLVRLKLSKRYKNEKLHLGSGKKTLRGWINIDIKNTADLRLDIRRVLPFENNSFSTIFSEHLFEHLEPDELLSIFRECRRVLKSGGKLIFSIPDFKTIFKSFFSKNKTVFKKYKTDLKRFKDIKYYFGNDWETLDFLARQNGEHKYMYLFEDFETLLQKAGFSLVRKRESIKNLDSKERKGFSLYVLTTK